MSNQLIGNCWPTQNRLLLLKAGLLDGSRAVEAWEAWLTANKEKFDEVDVPSYQLYPLVYRNLEKHSVCDPIYEKCKGIYRKNWTFNQVFWHKLSPYFNKLKQNGVSSLILLKGMAMMPGVYRDFGVRTIGDIDLLVPLCDVSKCVAVLNDAGLQNDGVQVDVTNQYELAINHAVTYRINQDVILDLHWSFLIESLFTGLDSELFQYARPVKIHGQSFYIPDPTMLLLQTCVHGVKSTEVASLRWIADSITILKQFDIEWQRMVEMALRARVALPLSLAFNYFNNEFDAGIPRHIISKLLKGSKSRDNQFEHWCNVNGLFFLVNWLRYCSRQGYQSWFSRLYHFPRFIQYRRRLPTLIHAYAYAIRWVCKKAYRKAKRVVSYYA